MEFTIASLWPLRLLRAQGIGEQERDVVQTADYALGFIVALNNAGYNVTPVLAGLGVGGLAFALSMQHTFGNMLGGLLIYTDGHFKVGDRQTLPNRS